MQPLMYDLSVQTFTPMLKNLLGLIEKAEAQLGAAADELPESRLAPDMFPLTRQVQIACDHAKTAAAVLSGREPPRFEDNEKTLAELKARVEKTLAYVQESSPSAFEGAEARDISLPLWGGARLETKGLRYLKDWALPHFYFHLVTAYDILRHKGVGIGKPDYVAHVGDMIRQQAA